MSETPAEAPHKRTWPVLAIILAATLGSGAAIAILTHGDAAIYDALAKPGFAPPGWAFPTVWIALYSLMSVALWLILRAEGRHGIAVVLYACQLAVNLAWPVLFFTLRAYGLAFVWLLLLLALIALLMDRAFRIAPLAGWLLAPYAAWMMFAGVLNFMIAQINP